MGGGASEASAQVRSQMQFGNERVRVAHRVVRMRTPPLWLDVLFGIGGLREKGGFLFSPFFSFSSLLAYRVDVDAKRGPGIRDRGLLDW